MALLLGLLFGSGLAVAQMTDPAKVLAFLDFFGAWDPTLAFVLGGAIATAAPGFWLARRLGRPVLGGALQVPTRRDIDPPLIAGAVLFGVGWGLVGLCPGPAIASISAGLPEAYVFLAAMSAGMLAFSFIRSG